MMPRRAERNTAELRALQPLIQSDSEDSTMPERLHWSLT